MRKIESHDFPGNVRELENMLERAVALSSGPKIGITDLPEIRSTRVAAEVSTEIPPEGIDLDRMLTMRLPHRRLVYCPVMSVPPGISPPLLYARTAAGFYSQPNVIAWIDEELLRQEPPDERLFELSMAGRESLHDFLNMLRAWAEPVDRRIEVTCLIASLYDDYRAKRRNLRDAVDGLVLLSFNHDHVVTETERRIIEHLDYGVDLAVDGIHGSLDAVGSEFSAFVAPFWEAQLSYG